MIAPGTFVRARARRYVVVDVDEHAACRTVRLAPIDDGGEAVSLLHPFDRLDVLPAVDAPRRASRRRVARACAAALRASYEAGTTRTVTDAHVNVLPYQLEPVLAVVRGEATRVLLADEVGLGKTIQAGLILSELRAHDRLRRALILTPAGLREQWAAELRERFALDATIVDAATLGALQQWLPPSVNPWTLPGIALASIDLLKRDELLPELEHVVWDAVVIDEAHHATRGTDRHRAASLTCSLARVVVLITATPHSGDRTAFADLCALGSLGDGELPLRIFRRSRADARASSMPRRTRLVGVHRAAAERHMDTLLRAYTTRVWREAGTDARLAMIVLRKRALSGPASLARSIARRLEGLAASVPSHGAGSQLLLDFADTIDGELLDEDREPGRELAAPGLADALTERQLLGDLLEASRRALTQDSKAERLVSAVLGAREPVIVFTEYRDTLEDLRRRLLGRTTVTVIHGGMLPVERQRSIAVFEGGNARVLLATDAAAEGLNLQRCCRWIVHYEVPWSPVRIEQRNGRVDRIGQGRRVHVWHLLAERTEEETVLARVAARSSIAARDLGDQQRVADAVFGGLQLGLPSATGAPRPASRGARAEAQRLAQLRRLPPALLPPVRPLCSVRRTRQHRQLLAVVRASVLDPRARQIASVLVGVRGPTLEGCKRAAARALGRRSRRSVALHAAFVRAIHGRERSIAAALARNRLMPMQPSLFNRDRVIEADRRSRRADAALGELESPSADASGSCKVRVALVGALPGRRP